MKYLKELVGIITPNKIKGIDLMDMAKGDVTQLSRLYQAIHQGKVATDAEARQLLFPQGASPSAYHNVKQHLKDRLLNTLFFVDSSRRDPKDRNLNYHRLNRDLTAAQLLLLKNARTAGMKQFERVVKAALRFEFSTIVFLAARELRLYYGTLGRDEKKYKYYQQLCWKYRKITELEERAEEYYAGLVISYVKKKSTPAELRNRAINYYEDLMCHYNEVETYDFRFYLALIGLMRHTILNDFAATLPTCDRVIAFFESKPFSTTRPVQICLHHKLVGHMQKEEYEAAKQAAEKSKAFLKKGDFNWYSNQEYLFLLAMHTGRYQDAYFVYHETTAQAGFGKLELSAREMWEIYRGYVYLLIDQKLVTCEAKDKSFGNFRIMSFINKISIFAKDKRGMNVAVRVLRIIFMILREQAEEAHDHIDATEKYIDRYLMNEDTQRSYHFVRMLLAIPQANFELGRIKALAAEHLSALEASSRLSANPFHKIEIIPYEALWELTLNGIKK